MSTRGKTKTNSTADPRVSVFIDGSNLYHSLEENCRRFDLDFNAFITKLCNGRRLVRAYYYNVARDPERNHQAYQDQQKFLNALNSIPYLEVRLGTWKIRRDVSVEKGVDVMVATDMLRFGWADLYDVAILVSGDGDFCYAVQTIKDMGKHVEVAAFPSNLASELNQVADTRELFNASYFNGLWSVRKGNGPTNNERSDEPRRRWWRRPRSEKASHATTG